ncbi:MAG: YhdP family protein [Woeseia sp.]
MQQLLRKILKFLAYSTAAVVIVLAIAVGLFRLMLPKLPEYQEQIKDWANAAIGMQVEFSGMDARWRLSGPELNFYDARLINADSSITMLTAEEISVGVGLLRLLRDRELVAERIRIHDTVVDVARESNGTWRVQGLVVNDLLKSRIAADEEGGPLSVVAEDMRVTLRGLDADQVHTVLVDRFSFQRDAQQDSVDASLTLPQSLGTGLQVAASRPRNDAEVSQWQFFVEGNALNAAGLSRMWSEAAVGFESGVIDLSLWVDLSATGVRRATANFAMSDIIAGGNADLPPIAARGRMEYLRSDDETLVVADDFVLRSENGEWPASAMQIRFTDDAGAGLRRVEGSASYLNLDDLPFIDVWLPESARTQLAGAVPSGTLRDVNVTATHVNDELSRFDLSAMLERVGVGAIGKWPELRGFSGIIRTDQSGGRLEIDATDMQLGLAPHVEETIDLHRAAGTVVWRRGGDGITILSDSIQILNADFASDSSLQVSLPADGSSPTIDLQSNWSVADIAIARRYLPAGFIKPALYRWLMAALVAGEVPAGTTRFVGVLERFPFDEGDGVFRVEAKLQNAVLRFSDKWPAARMQDLDLVVDNARLYSSNNIASSIGIDVANAQVEIADLRDPVLTIDASADSPLESIREFSRQSPIASVFGGQLDRIVVDGDAAFDFKLTYPILDRDRFTFTTTLRPRDGTVQFEGFSPPVSDLNGIVTISRDALSADSLSGTFLGGPVDIQLSRTADDARYTAMATATGEVAATGLTEELGMPMSDLLDGTTAYRADILFPRAGLEQPAPVRIDIGSDLAGMAIAMPAPLGKALDTPRPVAFTIEFLDRDRIESGGRLADDIQWLLAFDYANDGWDFDRGVLTVGGAAPGEAASRGLHIAGRTPLLNIDDWLELARRGGAGPGFGERVRSIDLVVDDLEVIGQHMTQHQLVVNRSALDWAVRLDGEQAVGTVTIPYDLESDRPLVLDMRKLRLPGSDQDAGGEPPVVDPRRLPHLIVRADDFALGKRQFGSLQAEFRRTAAGLQSESFIAEGRSFNITGSAGWVVDAADPRGQRSYLTGDLTSSDVDRTLQLLDYHPGITSDALNVKFDVSWSGGPSEDFLQTLDGQVGLRFGAGQLNEVEPGAGRVFGLMSVAALPRRLSLDFRDVFERGFVFDEITGNFRIVDAQAFTCDLSLKGPAADVGIVGRTGLAAEDYDQSAVVSANVGGTLPMVGAVVAGPQVAAALLIFSQIFKKPLQEIGQVYYGIEGGWEEPVIDVSDPQQFAESSALANCIEGNQ